MSDDPMDQIEMRQGLKSMAALVRHFYVELVSEGFTDIEALRITTAWLIETIRNGKSAPD